MPRSLVKFSLAIFALSVFISCGGPPKKPAPPDKTTDMAVAKGTTTTDMPEAGTEPTAEAGTEPTAEAGTKPAPEAGTEPTPEAGTEPTPEAGTGPVAEAGAPPRPLTIDEYIDKMMQQGSAMPPPMNVAEAPSPEGQPEQHPPETLAEKRLRERAAQKTLEEQADAYLVKYYTDQARSLYDDLRYEDARVMILRALEITPDDQDAIALYRDILAAQGKRGADMTSAKEKLAEEHRVRQKAAQTKANAYFNDGKQAFHEERYDAAIDAFENVLTCIRQSPYGTDWGTLKEDTEQFLFQAKERRQKAEEASARAAAAQALAGVRDQELKQRKQNQQKIDDLLVKGLQAYEDERYDIAENLADQVLAMDPVNARARELNEQAVRARHRKTADDTLRQTKERFREWKLDIQKTVVPWSSRPLTWPSQREWDRTNRRAKQLSDYGAGTELSPEDQALKNRLAEETISFGFTDSTIPDAINFIHTIKGINFAIDEKIRSDIEAAPINLKVNDLALDSALDLLLRYAGDDYTYTFKNGVVYITNKEGARAKPILRVHPVGDLAYKLTNFIAPNLILKPAGSEVSEDQPQFGKSEEGEIPVGGGGPDELMDLIQANIEPSAWEGGDYTISVSGNDKLVVNASPELQAKVANFLDDLRRFAGLVVTIETRFLSVNDDFLQDIGVDITGLGGQVGPLANLDDVTNGLEDNASAGFDNSGGSTPRPSAANPTSGVFFNNGGNGDYRGRNENLFDRALGNVLSNTGGAVIQYSYLDDTDVSMIMRAVEKSRHARLLQAPSLTVYNTQRANITLVNQLSFIQDFDVEVAQTAFIADPIVSIIQDGMTLDVRPTISHDRKYVTLELQPTIATLLRPIPTFQTSLGALTTPVTMQLPETLIQKSQTTVRVPDGGSLVIGGLKNISFVDMQSEVPFLAKIPILNFFFSRRGSSKEVSNLIIIVTARITDLQEEEGIYRTPFAR